MLRGSRIEQMTAQIDQEQTEEAHGKKCLQKLVFTLQEIETASFDRQEWRWNVSQCIGLDAD